jgi:hypothetical protein
MKKQPKFKYIVCENPFTWRPGVDTREADKGVSTTRREDGLRSGLHGSGDAGLPEPEGQV